ncbi:AAA family ATPase [Chloroflexota bacterium]
MPNASDYIKDTNGRWVLPERMGTATSTLEREHEESIQPSGLKSLADIISSPVELPRGLWGNFLFPQAVVFLSGEAGAGKTTFAYNLAGALSMGGDFLGFNIPHPLSVLIYDLESPDGLIKGRSQLIEKKDPERIKIGKFENFITEYCKLVSDSNGFDVTIIDTVSKAFRTVSEDDNAEARAEMSHVRRYTQETGSCLILVHHMGKAVQARSIYKARGASARPDLSDIVINFESINEDVIRLEQPKNRFVGGDLTIFLKKTEGQFETTKFAGYSDSMESFKCQKAITDIMPQGQERLRGEILNKLNGQGFSRPTIDRALTTLLQMGRITKPRYGAYCGR